MTTLAPELLVLDGQQRLTSLVYALTAPKLPLKDSSRPRRFFVDLERLRAMPDDDEIVFDHPLNELDGLRGGPDCLECARKSLGREDA